MIIFIFICNIKIIFMDVLVLLPTNIIICKIIIIIIISPSLSEASLPLTYYDRGLKEYFLNTSSKTL